MTDPPSTPPPPDPTADRPRDPAAHLPRDPTADLPRDPAAGPPPFATPQSPPYPAGDGGYPTYRPGSAPVEPPPAYQPVTAVPAYPPKSSAGSHRLAIGLVATLVVALALCGLIGAGAFIALGHDEGSPVAAPAPEPAVARSDARTDFPTIFPTVIPSWFAEAPGGTPRDVVYQVTGDRGPVNVTYLGADDTVESEQVDLPWRKEFTINTGLLPLTVTAFGPMDGTLSCQISVDGHQLVADTDDTVVACFGLIR